MTNETQGQQWIDDKIRKAEKMADNVEVWDDPNTGIEWVKAEHYNAQAARIAELEAEVETLRYMLPVKVGEFSAALVKKGPTQ